MLNDRYQPKDVEEKIFSFWEKGPYFAAQDQSTKPPFSIIMPPPNVTGFLHLGHALDVAIQDCLIRWKRMNGFNALWLPGIDHAGIATQAVIEKELKKEGLTRHQLGREAFLQKVWDWKQQYGDRISDQQKRLGSSCDWSRRVFTLDEGPSKAVRKVFVQLYQKGQIYRGTRLVNWSGPLETAISDLEVEFKETKGTLFHLRYPIVDDNLNKGGDSQNLIVATTRPETLLGDVAVAVHPEDERYKNWIGKMVTLPLTTRKIPIIADEFVDPTFGSGVVKVTPAHDFNDYQVGKRHQLPLINILDKKTHLNEEAGAYQGLSVIAGRKKIVEDLKALGLLEKEEAYTHNVGYCSRTGAVVEPFLSEQWFVKMSGLQSAAKRVVESGTLKIDPESWTKVYLHWMNILEDWCISRQLWWGHRIPAWSCVDCSQTTVAETDPTQCSHCNSKNIQQDEDVLDTWFSSALWPFSTLGWPEKTEALKTFYPTNVLVTGHDILFFWVARMVMFGLEFVRDVPFRTVLLHGLVRDSQGRKMSKSLGNSIDPIEMIEKFGADALRFSLLAHMHSGKDLKISEQRIEGYRNFMNKLWNAARFILAKHEEIQLPKVAPKVTDLSLFDRWILDRLETLTRQVEDALEQFRISDAASAIYEFSWYEFCDWYIEFSKTVLLQGSESEKQTVLWVLSQVLNRTLRLLHPFAPFITEEIYQKWPIKQEACIVDQFPTIRNDKALFQLGSKEASQEIELVKTVITAVRNIRGENRISPAVKIDLKLLPVDDKTQKVLSHHREVMQNLARTQEIAIAEKADLQKCAVNSLAVGDFKVTVVVPLEGLVDFAEEVKRLQKLVEKLKKEIYGLEGRLNNENFVKNADPEVVATDKVLLQQQKQKLSEIQDALLRY